MDQKALKKVLSILGNSDLEYTVSNMYGAKTAELGIHIKDVSIQPKGDYGELVFHERTAHKTILQPD